MMARLCVLYIIIPCYNEEAVLPVTAPVFLQKLREMTEKNLISDESRILFVNDGSRDGTWQIIRGLAAQDRHYLGICQSRNRGHQNAVLAGLMEAKDRCDITISIDCDGQDDPNAMEEMVRQYLNGYEIVYGVRSSRESDTFFKRFTAESFYRLLSWMGVEVVFNHADYRLLSNRVMNELQGFREVNIYLRGMIPLIGFRSTEVPYERHERLAGDSHYPLSRMLSLAFDGITSLSIKPIRMIATLGVFVSIFSFALIIWCLVQHSLGNTVPGWSSLCAIVCLVGGIQLISLGIIGEYIGKIYLETKARPRYIISERTYETHEPPQMRRTEPESAGEDIPRRTEPESAGEGVPRRTEPESAGEDIPRRTEPESAGEDIPRRTEPESAGEDIPRRTESESVGDGVPRHGRSGRREKRSPHRAADTASEDAGKEGVCEEEA